MGVADYLGTQSEIEYAKQQREREASRVDSIPQVERQEISQIFSDKGLSPELADR